MIAQLVGGFLAGLVAVALYWFFTHTDADKAPLFRSLRPKPPQRVPMPRGFEDVDQNCNRHPKFYRPQTMGASR